MATWLKQSTAVDIAFGPFLDETDGKTAETGLTLSQADIRLKKNAGDWAQKNESTSATHEENGWYEVNLDATDTGTLGILIVAAHESGALPVWREFLVVPANMYDSLVGGTDTLQADVQQWLGTAAATPTTAGVPEVDLTHIAGSAVSTTTAQLGVNVVQMSGDGTAADTLELFAEALDQSTGQLDSGSFAAGAITAAAIATGAIDDDALADDAVTAIWAKAMQDLSSVPSATASVLDAVNWIFELHRNKRTQTTSTEVVYKDDGTTQLATSTKTDASGTFTRNEYS